VVGVQAAKAGTAIPITRFAIRLESLIDTCESRGSSTWKGFHMPFGGRNGWIGSMRQYCIYTVFTTRAVVCSVLE